MRKKNKLKALHGASLPREFHLEDLAKIFNKKIKTASQLYLNGRWNFTC